MLLNIIQIFSFIAVIICSLCKTKKNILIWVFIANLSNFAVMLLANETDGWAGSLATTLRALLFLNKDRVKTNTLLYISILLHVTAFAISYQDIYSCCILCATLSVCISQWFGTPLQIKVFALIGVLLWMIYTIHVGLYLDLPKRIVEGIFLLIAITKLKLDKRKQKESPLIDS